MWCTTRVNTKVFSLLIDIINLQLVSDVLDAIMFANNTNFFYSHKGIKASFLKVNN